MAKKQTRVQSGCKDMGYLTDSEKRLLFSALTREKGICKVIDEQKENGILLTPIVESLERKFYYDRFENLPAEMTDINGVSGIEIDHNTICQYTGLTDKNGNKILENDIVKMTYRDNDFEIGVIRYDTEDVRYRFCVDDAQYSFDRTDTIEVIGTIFDKPELLEGGA